VYFRFKILITTLCFLFSADLVYSQCTATINSFPYQESFESGTSNWVSGGINNDWAWGTPAKSVINSAGTGSKCWITGGLTASFYSFGERSWVESPCFDFTNLDRPYVSFQIFWETEKNYDGGNFQYSTDLGITWINVGTANENDNCYTSNWFNQVSISNMNGLVTNRNGWSGNIQPTSGSCNGGNGSGAWKVASHCLKILANKPSVKFRFTFGAGTTCNDFDGIAFDNFYLGVAPSLTDSIVTSCVSGRTISFSTSASECKDQWDWNFGDTISSSNNSSGKEVLHEFTSGGVFQVTLNTKGECTVDTQMTALVKILDAYTTSTPVTCNGERDGSAQVVVNFPGNGISYTWSHDVQLNTSVAFGLTPNLYQVTISEPGVCTMTLAINVSYGPDAFPEVSLGNDTSVCPGSDLNLYPGSYSTYRWHDNSTDSVFSACCRGFYSVTISNSAGCEASDSVFINEDCIHDIIIPDAFTPNGDGLNEVFSVYGSETNEFEISIFNRWGELIFYSDKREVGWDGSFKGQQAQEGFYSYLVNYSIYGNEFQRKGSVVLLR
jgi:gliding motility-associated-like protein